MMENGSVVSETATVSRNGQMAHSMMVTGKITELTVKESSFILMEIFTMEIGSTIKLMVTVCTIISMVPCTKVTGVMISNTAKEKKAGLMALSTKDFIWLVRNMEWVFTAGTTAVNIMENGSRIKSKDSEHIAG